MMLMGGLTVVEALLLASWITLNVVMLWNWCYYYEEPYNYGKPLPCTLGAAPPLPRGCTCTVTLKPHASLS